MPTPYHAAYWAHALSISDATGTVADLSRSIASAKVDLNPHQVDAALFAIRSPLSKGVILADEVGLGKTIEAGLVIAQRWAERRRIILLIVPASLRKQWQEELRSKFGLNSAIIDGRSYSQARDRGDRFPFAPTDQIAITSYQFAAAKAADLRDIPFDLVVFDEAHRLRNAYKPDAKIAGALREATADRPKLFLTATPLQNSLMELYGLTSFIDPHLFGDERSFREHFGGGSALDEARASQLRWRLSKIMTRTLRSQVLEYVRFTNRTPITQDFQPSDAEQRLYDEVSAYLQRPILAAVPTGQRALMTLVLRRLLASSSFAIAQTLRKLIERLELMLADKAPDFDIEAIAPDVDEMDDLADEVGREAGEIAILGPEDIAMELADLRRFVQLAESITTNAKGAALIAALTVAFDRASALGASRKAVVFTESRRTQEYLTELLRANGYAGRVVTINGTNTDPASRALHDAWVATNGPSGRVTGSRSVDTRAAIVDAFRDEATILVATEAAAEGVNLQFCSLVVNYDLPWNPQRIEQRIGRCHRYGQQHDVVVVNLINQANAADQRVYQILATKFRLFEGVFGASDGVLGVLESGVDIERRIAEVYQRCRTREEIGAAFDALQAELETEIADRVEATRTAVLDHFDEDVQTRLRIHKEQAQQSLEERQRWLWELSRFEFGADATFDPKAPRFEYRGDRGPRGRYHLLWPEAERLGEQFYHAEHELADAAIASASLRRLPVGALQLDLSGHRPPVEALSALERQWGWLVCGTMQVQSLQKEQHLVLAAMADNGTALDPEQCRRLLRLGVKGQRETTEKVPARATEVREAAIKALLEDVERRNAGWYDEEVQKLDAWADDLRLSLERELKELDRAISEARRGSLAAVTLTDKLAAQRELKRLEGARAEKRRALYDAQDQIAERRDQMIAAIERQLGAQHTWSEVFVVRWQLL